MEESRSRDQTHIPCEAGNFNLIFNPWTTREVLAFLFHSPVEAVIQRQTHIEQNKVRQKPESSIKGVVALENLK